MSKEYYDCSKILKEGSVYNIVIGQRSNGKTYGFIEEALGEYCENGHASVYIRRYDESITGANIFKLCTPHIPSLVIMSKGKWNNFEYKNRCFSPIRVNEENGKIEERGEPFLYCCGLNSWEHKKGQDRGFVRYIIFDEFLTRDTYLNDEYAKFMNLFTKNKINPLIGSAGVSAVPMAARVSQTVGQEYDKSNFLLMHAMGPNVAGVVGSAVAAGILLAFLG